MTASAHPFDWHLHVFWLLAFPALVVTYLSATRRAGCEATTRQKLLFVAGIVVVIAAVTWPLGDLAVHWLLMALVLQRLLLTLAVPPLLVLGTPRPLIAGLTRPAAVDAVLRVVVRPLPAVAIVTVVAVGTLTTGAVSLAAHSDVARVLIELVVLGSGFVLWAPVLTELPGGATAVRPRTRRISDRPVDRAELPLHRVDLRPALPLSDLHPPRHRRGHVLAPRSAVGRLSRQAEHHRGAVDRGLRDHEARAPAAETTGEDAEPLMSVRCGA